MKKATTLIMRFADSRSNLSLRKIRCALAQLQARSFAIAQVVQSWIACAGTLYVGVLIRQSLFSLRGGSFWSNCTTDLLASTTDADRQARTRNRCNGEGYESVALIALRVGEERLGLLQLNDRRKDRFSPEDISLWERLAGYLAVALAKFQADEALQQSKEKVSQILNSAAEGIYGLDLNGNCTFCNLLSLRILGYHNEDDLIGKNMHQLIHHTKLDGTLYPRMNVLLTGQ